jgi:large subunit ribosomal protein L24
MVKNSFSTTWKSSTQPRKQRKYRYNAPLHLKQKYLHVHLSKELRDKYTTRNVQIKKGDKVLVLRGKFSKKEGKVDRVSLKYEKVYITGIEMIKKDGTKLLNPFNPSNLMVVTLNLDDKKRKQKLERTRNVVEETKQVNQEENKND